jgi:hypothetical protein
MYVCRVVLAGCPCYRYVSMSSDSLDVLSTKQGRPSTECCQTLQRQF